jgi:3-hydroxyacyl-[acyl-carrier-protein] dehydratase
MRHEVRRVIRADHPSLPGHFPDRPLVPGVVILDEVLAALAEWRKNSRLAGIRTVKFLAPLKPEEPFTIYFSAKDESAAEMSFCCCVQDRIIVEGRLEVLKQKSISP